MSGRVIAETDTRRRQPGGPLYMYGGAVLCCALEGGSSALYTLIISHRSISLFDSVILSDILCY